MAVAAASPWPASSAAAIEGVVGYASIRQSLVRLATAGVVTKLRRGLHGLADRAADRVGCGTAPTAEDDKADCDSRSRDIGRALLATQDPGPSPYTMKKIEQAIAATSADFEATNAPYGVTAWIRPVSSA